MDEEISIETEPTMPSVPQNQSQLLKYLLFVFAGLLLLAGAVVGYGYWWGTKISTFKTQTSKPQPKTQIQEAQTPTPTSPVEDETKNWKIYTNTKYGYSVKYSSNLTPKEEPADDIFLIRTVFWDTVNDTAVFGIEVRETILAEAVEGVKDDHQKMSVIMELRREDKIVHQGYTGYRLEYGSEATVGTDVIIIMSNNTYSYLLRSDKDTVDQILSAFQFLN